LPAFFGVRRQKKVLMSYQDFLATPLWFPAERSLEEPLPEDSTIAVRQPHFRQPPAPPKTKAASPESPEKTSDFLLPPHSISAEPNSANPQSNRISLPPTLSTSSTLPPLIADCPSLFQSRDQLLEPPAAHLQAGPAFEDDLPVASYEGKNLLNRVQTHDGRPGYAKKDPRIQPLLKV
jgi:hypothetical protein